MQQPPRTSSSSATRACSLLPSSTRMVGALCRQRCTRRWFHSPGLSIPSLLVYCHYLPVPGLGTCTPAAFPCLATAAVTPQLHPPNWLVLKDAGQHLPELLTHLKCNKTTGVVSLLHCPAACLRAPSCLMCTRDLCPSYLDSQMSIALASCTDGRPICQQLLVCVVLLY